MTPTLTILHWLACRTMPPPQQSARVCYAPGEVRGCFVALESQRLVHGRQDRTNTRLNVSSSSRPRAGEAPALTTRGCRMDSGGDPVTAAGKAIRP